MKKKARILIIEDDVTVAMDLENDLTSGGYDVTGVYSIEEEVQDKVKEEKPDLVLMGAASGGGLDVIQTAKGFKGKYDLPVICLIPHSSEKALEETIKKEPYCYIFKPVDEVKLKSAIEMAFFKHRKEQELKETYKELNDIFADLKHIDEMKGKMIDNGSHDLGTSITVASVAIEMAMSEVDNLSREKHLTMAEKALIKQSMIVEELLNTAYVREKGVSDMVEGEFDISTAVASAITNLKPAASSKEIIIESCVPSIVLNGDYRRIQQAVMNLLDNAIKLSEKGGEISVSGTDCGTHIEVSIRDHRTGVTSECKDSIFDEFNKGDLTRLADNGGVVADLGIAKKIVEAYNGKIGLEVDPGEGARFFLRLPKLSPVELDNQTLGMYS